MSKNEAETTFITLIMLMLTAIVSASFGASCGKTAMQAQYRQDAIAHNAAHWEVTPDGTTVFVWNKEEE